MAFAPAFAAIRDKAESAIPKAVLPLAWEADDYRPERSPWCLMEVVGGDNEIQGVGTPGGTLYGHDGLIRAFVHVPKGSGQTIGLQLADMVGDALMRLKLPAPADPDYVRTETPRVDEGVAFDKANTFAVVMVTIPFVFWHHR